MKKRLISIFVVLMMLVSMLTVPVFAESDEQPETVILFTNDVHCGIEDNWGYAGLAAVKKAMEDEGINTILVDAGDHVQGGPIGTLSTGGLIIDIMNFVGYDLAIPGNHEFDYSMERFFELIDAANCPYISCNFMNYENGQPTTPVLDAYKIFEAGDKKIAFVGVCTPETITKSTPTYFQNDQGEYIYGFCQDDTGDGVVEATQAAIDAAKAEGADYVVIVGHLGIDEQSSPWMSTEVISRITGADAFIDGHSHSVICEELPDAEGHTVLHGQTGTKFANIGALKIYADGSLDMVLLPAPEEVEGDPETQAYIDDINAQFDELLHTVVAYTPHILTVNDPDTGERAVRSKETNLGDMCADAYRTLLGADIAFVNGGGVRANINAGEITFENILNVHPFGNSACLAEVTGQQILDALEMGSRNCPDENGGFLQVAGITYEIHTDMEPNVIVGDDKMWQGPAGIPYRVQNVMVMNRETRSYEPLDLERTYTLASHNYMLKSQGDGFAMFGTQNITLLQDEVMIDNAVLINYIQSMPGGEVTLEDGTVVTYDHIVQGYEDPRGEGRIIIISETEPGEPGETPEPTDPNPPATGAITLIGFGGAAIIAGAGAFIFRRKED
ncbi:MAG: bifunctional metallophosphatase/5'-nucleotidase [Clostridia bacterium]|nr:bifunctional metallophosphatase/5'-nucleotidase [Clostridia bacterium]MBR6006204.1 bifunctional metallophosphatase/5'-nucleotidase [Clostridia bacterium]